MFRFEMNELEVFHIACNLSQRILLQ